MGKDHQTTEKIIFNTAQDVFEQTGYDGSTMQEIADKAGINKALLHYYYRSKSRLFGVVFQQAFTRLVQPMLGIWKTDGDIFNKTERFIDQMLDKLQAHPYMASFVLHEITRNPEHLQQIISQPGGETAKIIQRDLDAVSAEYGLPPKNAVHFMCDLLGMAIYPFIARPIISTVFQLDNKAFDQIIEERKKHIPKMIKVMLLS
ncbi:TetR/AcrR family transcriptional regulator [Rhodohalobacter sp. 8-1]|uniref:TetR/AcrR family transcriptional regulator n=1 Tax=Rhodohalobacter sp. 8-1 TaxID=3131972 RepID=UPI0030EB8700